MRYIYSMPVERIIKYFADNGFTLRKATANKLIARSADVLENFYKAICQVVLQQDYVSADETYHKVLLAKTKPTDKGSKKGYLWAVSAPKLGLVFFVYEDGSRSEQVILNVFSDYKGTIQSDAYAPYRKLESDAYPDIMRIACLQHVKRDFIDCGKEDKDALEVVDIINRFYQEDKKHKVGVNGYLKLKKSLTIEISKKKTVPNNKTEYVIDKITLTSLDSNDKTGTIDVEKNKLLTLKGVLLEDNVTTVDITLEVTSTGSITIKVENKSVSGDYNYFIHKNVDGGSPNGIEFKVTGTYNGTLTAKDNGDTETRSIAITKDNINTNDELTIEENTNDSDILGLKNKIKLTIKKDIDPNSNKYRISHILVEELDTQNKAEKDISKTESTVITLDNVVIANSTYSEKSSIEIRVDLDNDGKQTIKITVNNKKVQPKNYTFRIKKVDLNNKPITGRKFNVYKINNDNTRTQN